MGGVLLWLISVAVTIFITYLVIKAAINNSVMAELYHETKQMSDIQNRSAKSIELLSQELAQIRTVMEQRNKQD